MKSPQPDKYTKISNELLEQMGKFRVPGELMQVFLVIMRKTWGFGKKEDYISLSQFVELTGMKKSNIVRTLSKLITHKLIIKTDNERGCKYGIQKDYDQWISLSTVITPLSKAITSVIKTDNAPLSKVIPTKENTTKKTITKEIIHKNVLGFGNPDINDASKYFLEKMQIPKEDCSQKESRRYWFHLLRESKRGIEGVKWLIDQASSDDWYKNNITSSKDLYYKRIKLIARKRGDTPVIAVMKGGSDEQTMETGSGNRSILLN